MHCLDAKHDPGHMEHKRRCDACQSTDHIGNTKREFSMDESDTSLAHAGTFKQWKKVDTMGTVQVSLRELLLARSADISWLDPHKIRVSAA
jgi:hypothetical protein